MSKAFIRIGGAREHNLKNLTLNIPRDKLVVITGLSGSGKPSLAFDTIYAEGQRKCVESLPAYAQRRDRPSQERLRLRAPELSVRAGVLGPQPPPESYRWHRYADVGNRPLFVPVARHQLRLSNWPWLSRSPYVASAVSDKFDAPSVGVGSL